MTIEDAVVRMRELPPERQREVLDFVEFLEGRTQIAGGVSALELAGNLIGSLEGGPGDLASNPDHLNSYGKD